MEIKHNSWVICDMMYTTDCIDMYHNCLPESFIFITFYVPSQVLIFSVLIIKHNKITIDCIYLSSLVCHSFHPQPAGMSSSFQSRQQFTRNRC